MYKQINSVLSAAINPENDIRKDTSDFSAYLSLENNLLKLLNSDYSEAYNAHNNGFKLFRGSNDIESAFVAYSGIRRAEMGDNIYTVLISDILPSWKEYPRRNKSFIMTNDKQTAQRYTDKNIYLIFPKNGAKLGISPTPDMWSCVKFGMLTSKLDIFSLNSLNDNIINLIAHILLSNQVNKEKEYNNENIKFESPIQCMNIVKEIFKENDVNAVLNLFKKCEKICSLAKKDSKLFNLLYLNYSKNKFSNYILEQLLFEKPNDFISILDNIFNPVDYKFKNLLLSDINESINSAVEIWTESPCLFIREDIFNENIKEDS